MLLSIVVFLALTTSAFGDYFEALDSASKARKVVFLRFTATWCGPCHAFQLNTLSNEEVKSKLRQYFVYTCDVDKEPAIWKAYADRFGREKPAVTGIPAYFLVIPDKEYVLKWNVGNMPPSEFLLWLDAKRR